MNAKQIIDRIGRERLASALSVTESAIKEAGRKGTLPSAWFAVVSQLASDAGFEVPVSAFTFRALAADMGVAATGAPHLERCGRAEGEAGG